MTEERRGEAGKGGVRLQYTSHPFRIISPDNVYDSTTSFGNLRPSYIVDEHVQLWMIELVALEECTLLSTDLDLMDTLGRFQAK